MSEGNVPLRRFDLRLRICNAVRLPSVFGGIGPLSPIAGSLRPNTRVPSEEQFMPTHEVQRLVVLFQLSFLP